MITAPTGPVGGAVRDRWCRGRLITAPTDWGGGAGKLPPLKGAGTAQAVTGGCLTEVSACADVFIAFCRGRVSRPGVPSVLMSSICGIGGADWIGGAAGGGTPPLRILLVGWRFHRWCGVDQRCRGRTHRYAPTSADGSAAGINIIFNAPQRNSCSASCKSCPSGQITPKANHLLRPYKLFR